MAEDGVKLRRRKHPCTYVELTYLRGRHGHRRASGGGGGGGWETAFGLGSSPSRAALETVIGARDPGIADAFPLATTSEAGEPSLRCSLSHEITISLKSCLVLYGHATRKSEGATTAASIEKIHWQPPAEVVSFVHLLRPCVRYRSSSNYNTRGSPRTSEAGP